ncbi:MAG: NUDIX hydrolase [Thermoprotei archaeon]|nr:NUDIX hydrolase [Thermoprotei archaeon]
MSKPLVGVGCLVIDGGKVLLIKRAYPPGAGKWSIPGGHVELGEDLIEAAVRELREETRLEAEPRGIVNVDTLIATSGEKNIKVHYVLIDVLFANPKGELKASSDALEAGFYAIDEALRMQLTPSVKGLLEKIKRGELPLEKPINPLTYKITE